MKFFTLAFLGMVSTLGIMTIFGCEISNYFENLGITTKFIFFCR
jgi:hypothetical protein|tara:strand:- start:64 stop:195 length:132 start_codon:yes stop_codon:yes gene_type:complete